MGYSRFVRPASITAQEFARRAIVWWLPVIYLLISSAFYLRTYDSAQVKITLLQMGGACLLGLWLCRVIEDGRKAISGEDFAYLAPFLAFLASGILSFIHAPYHWSSMDLFLRRIFYMTFALIIVKEFDEPAMARLVRVLIASAWIATVYGTIQWFDYRVFPVGVGQGIDPFLWRGAFGERVFSTYGNPNFFADYLVIMFPILVCQYFKTRKANLLALIVLDVFNVYASQTKGAWIGLAFSCIILAATYMAFFRRDFLSQYRLRIGASMLALLLLTFSGVVLKLRKSFASVNFRVFTWESTWEMIRTQPLRGTGIGSFWVVYPAFRRPPIFHIEGRHNTETDHAENEYLEVLFDEGIVGFGIFIWLIFSACVMAYRALDRMVSGLKLGERAPPLALDLIGSLVALQGMLAHNFFDVSLRFVSSGVYLGLLSAMVVNISRGRPGPEPGKTLPDSEPSAAPPIGTIPGGSSWGNIFLGALKISAFMTGVYFLARLIFGGDFFSWTVHGFADLQVSGDAIRSGGESLQWALSWGSILFCAGGIFYAFSRVLWLTRNCWVPVIVMAVIPILYLFWGFFCADVYQNLAIAYSRQQDWAQALKNYQIVTGLNPSYIMSYYFEGNVFADRFNMTKVCNPNWGDAPGEEKDDYERAMAAYDKVRQRSPNYVQTWYQLGTLHMKYGEYLNKQNRLEEGQRAWDKALEYFNNYLKIDPVFPQTYFKMAAIHIFRRQFDSAIASYRDLILAQKCRIAPNLLKNDILRETLLAYQPYIRLNGGWTHLHEYPQAYTDMGGAYWMKGDFEESARLFQKALELDPNFAPARQNLENLLKRRVTTPSPLSPVIDAPMAPVSNMAPFHR